MKIFAVGMNYPQHNKEVQNTLLQKTASADSSRDPIIFTKADSALLKDHKPFFLPDFMGQIDYETELVVRICRLGKSIPEQFAHRYYDAVTVGIDFTARDMQRELRADGMPWEIAKGFDGSAVIGEWIDKSLLPPIQAIHFSA
ncbi:MAG: fumarylacetoacetate hydrolase family protein, partial [Prevotella sp.]|nr:fumarylacetoacetate hydrolase family protein [Prevotella sp.]